MTTNKTALVLERDGPVAIIINNDAPINRMTLWAPRNLPWMKP
jgi:hypothetical protein